jgi:hypothetical protein
VPPATGLADPKIKARFADLGGTVLAGSPADFGKLIRKRPPTEAGGLFLLVSASFYKPYRPATSFNAGVVSPLADSLRAAM